MSTPVPGWMTDSELDCLAKYARRCPATGVILEIGTYCGLSTRALCKATEKACIPVFTVDHLAGIDDKPGPDDQRHWIAKVVASYPERLTFIPARSEDLIWGAHLALLFLDGNHSQEAVESELRRLAPLVVPGGHILLHDYASRTYPGVKRAWYAYPGNAQFSKLECVGTLGVFRRRHHAET